MSGPDIPHEMDPAPAGDRTWTVLARLKADSFGSISAVEPEGRPDGRAILRDIRTTRPWFRMFAAALLGREARCLQHLAGVDGVPSLLQRGRGFLLRSWMEGTTLAEAPSVPDRFWITGRRLLRALRRRGVTHNDTHKPANWIVKPDGSAALVDFQLASRFKGRGPWYRLCAREDLRHLLKQKRRFARERLTPSEKRFLLRKSWIARMWLATVKPVYVFVTRRVLGTRDGEGRGKTVATERT